MPPISVLITLAPRVIGAAGEITNLIERIRKLASDDGYEADTVTIHAEIAAATIRRELARVQKTVTS